MDLGAVGIVSTDLFYYLTQIPLIQLETDVTNVLTAWGKTRATLYGNPTTVW